MLKRFAVCAAAAALGFLLATSPVVGHAAGQITGFQIKDNSIKGRDIQNNKLKGKDVRDNSLTGADVDESTLTGVDASALAALPGSAYAQVAQPAYTPLALNAGYSQFAGFSAPGFLKDTLGFVHLKGTMNCPSGGTAFTLPAGVRPAQTMIFPLMVGESGAGNVQVQTNGNVVTFNADGIAHPCGVDGITFRTDTTTRASDAQRPTPGIND